MLIWSNLAKKMLTGDTDIELEDLVGPHWLSGVDETTEKINNDNDYSYPDTENCNVISFILDDITFSAIEDPQDGWRSSMREIIVGEYKVNNTFKPIPVVCKMKERSENGECEILEIWAESHIILEAGTDNTDDYYPFFVAHWDPTKITFKTD